LFQHTQQGRKFHEIRGYIGHFSKRRSWGKEYSRSLILLFGLLEIKDETKLLCEKRGSIRNESILTIDKERY